MATFTWTPDAGAAGEHEPSRRTVKFGDGYEQRAPNGINVDMAKWSSLSFSGRSAAEGAAIAAFLKARGGTESFTWTPPGGTSGNYVCPKWTEKPVSYGTVVTADFYQVP